MSFNNECFYQQLRQLLRTKRSYSCEDRRQTSFRIPKRSRNHWYTQRVQRYFGGQDHHARTHFRHRLLPSSDSSSTTLTSQSGADNPYTPVPLLHIWLRLNALTPTSSYSLRRQQFIHRMRLEQRPLLENAREFLALHWNNFRNMILPSSRFADAGSQTTQYDLTPSPTPWLHWLKQNLHLISRKLETALTPVGPSPKYVNTSAAMELLNITDLSEQLNSMLIDYLVDHDETEFMLTSTSSYSQLGII